MPFIPTKPGLVIDIGAGSGRDAAWFAAMDWSVIAVEPAERLRSYARELHPSPRITWENDRLPDLSKLLRTGVAGDLVWLSAVWMHLPLGERRRAFRKLVTLMKPGGRLMISLREGPLAYDRPMFPVSIGEIEELSREHGLAVRALPTSLDAMGRADIRWTSAVLELPDDGTGALPLIRGIILQDAKAATYKLAFLRVIARIADQSASFARYGETHVEMPLGLVALYWLRMFKRLVEGDIPQTPRNRDHLGLGFVKPAFWAMDIASPFELRPGNRFGWPRSGPIVRAIGDAASTIARMPARHLTFANGQPIFPTTYRGRPSLRESDDIILDAALFWAYGATKVPLHVWVALRRLAVWIEPMLLAEWQQLVANYARSQNRDISSDRVAQALRWADPQRDTIEVRKIASKLLEKYGKIFCVWTGKSITHESELDIDHCFPFVAWPCGDLWNLVPATKRVNNHKRDKLISSEVLARSASSIGDWWDRAYRGGGEAPQALRFQEEALSTLPIEWPIGGDELVMLGLAEAPARPLLHSHSLGGSLENERIIEAMQYQRLRLRQDQNLPEWHGLNR